MPKTAMLRSSEQDPEIEALSREIKELRRENAALKAQIAAIHAGVKAVLDAVGVPDIKAQTDLDGPAGVGQPQAVEPPGV